jgi:hypothetical protein
MINEHKSDINTNAKQLQRKLGNIDNDLVDYSGL